MRDTRIPVIADTYGSLLMQASQGAVRTGFVFLVFAALLWVFLLIGVDADSWPQQIWTPIGTTVLGLVMLAFYPLYRAGWNATVLPRVRALLEGSRVEGIIESVEATDHIVSTKQSWENAVDARPQQGKKQISYRYTVDGRVIRRTTIPFAASLLGSRSTGDSIPVYVSPLDPEHGEADIFRIRET